jgi:hypothetical protein
MRLFVVTLLALTLCARASSAQVPTFRHVFIIVLENHEYDEVIGNPTAPYINQLARENGLATGAFGVTHPSLPNYMALIGGETFFTSDCVGCLTPAANIADRIEGAGRTWAAYMEDMPAPCGTTDSGLYVAKHNPFVHYSNIAGNATRCNASVVPFSRFSADLSRNTLADYVWISPNLCNDMHDCPVATGDAWLASVVPQILQSAAFTDSVLFVTFDEGTSSIGGGGRIPLIVASRWTAPGLKSATTATHYSVLRTIEDAWRLAPLGQSASATAMTEFFGQPSVAPTEQVIHATDVTAIQGTWRKTTDLSAADNIKLSTPDDRVGALAAAAVTPSNYFDATFQASPATRYRVWLRMHAVSDSKWNDSVFVQFSDSVDAVGRPIYRIGSTAGYTVNLWSCATCQSFGWGWQRNAYWLTDSGDVWFPTAGTHTIRVQVREDGVEVDQIVISPAKYLADGPGPNSADATIVPKPTGSAPPPVSTPFSGSPAAIPGTLRASDFDNGGEGVAYHDASAGNSGVAYRQTDVDLEPSSDGGYDVGWIAAGEWLKYTVNVAAAGPYTASFRVAAPGQGGTFHLEMNGVNVSGPIVIPATGGWQVWQTVTKTVTLSAGTQVGRLVMDATSVNGIVGNIISVRFTAAGSSTPYTGTAVSLPGRVQAENFDNGGEGIAYHDASAGNSGGVYRSTDVDIESTSPSGYDVGWVGVGEWLNYTVSVGAAGNYVLNARVASPGPGGMFHLEMNGVNVTGSLTIPNTGGWQSWQTITKTVSLNAGLQVARLVVEAATGSAVGNFDWFEVVSPSAP